MPSSNKFKPKVRLLFDDSTVVLFSLPEYSRAFQSLLESSEHR